VIDYSKGKEPAVSQIKQWVEHGDDLGVTAIVGAEFFAGLKPEQVEYWRRVFATLSYWPASLEAAEQAGIWRAHYGQRGLRLSTADTLNAAVALDLDATLVTGNLNDYPMPEIRTHPLSPLPGAQTPVRPPQGSRPGPCRPSSPRPPDPRPTSDAVRGGRGPAAAGHTGRRRPPERRCSAGDTGVPDAYDGPRTLVPGAVQPPAPEPVVDGGSRRVLVGQGPPLAAGADDGEDRVEDLAHRVLPGAPAPLRRRQVGRQAGELGVGRAAARGQLPPTVAPP
jgi:predicted nucleic acid-binding protein